MKKKLFNRQQRSYDVLFNSIYLSNTTEAHHRIRVPLSTLVDYKGFTALVIAVPPIRPELGLSLGFNAEGRFECIDFDLKTELRYVGEVLNQKDFRTKLKIYNVEKI